MTAAKDGGAAEGVVGTWGVTIATPIGKQHVVFEITQENQSIRGTARQGNDVVDFVDPVLAGNRLTWTQFITKPLKLKLEFDVTVDRDILTGTSRAGRLPKSKVVGKRVV